MAEIEVTGIAYYPIKGASASYPETASFTELGIEYDREWIVVSPDGTFMSQRREPELATVEPIIIDEGLLISAPGMETISVDAEIEGDERPIDFFRKVGSGIFQGTEVAEWFSDFLRNPAELYRVAKPRTVRPDCQVEGATTHVGFADTFPLLIVNEASLAELNTHMTTPVAMDRFRGNIIVSGDELEAYDEDYWREVRIGELTAYVVRACARCPVPNTDQISGERTNLDVTKALRKTRRGTDAVSGTRGDFFGQNAVHVFEPGVTIELGDKVEVVERSDNRNIEGLS